MFDSCCNEEAVTWKEQKKILNPEMLDFLQLHCAVYSKKNSYVVVDMVLKEYSLRKNQQCP